MKTSISIQANLHCEHFAFLWIHKIEYNYFFFKRKKNVETIKSSTLFSLQKKKKKKKKTVQDVHRNEILKISESISTFRTNIQLSNV